MKGNKRRIALNRTEEGKHVNIFLIFSVTLILVLLIAGSWIMPDRDMSENENRYLTQIPELSISNVLEGKFESQLENYLSDQIIGRENWIRIMSNTLKGIGYKDINGVYLLDEGRLAERVTPVDFKSDRYANNLDEIVKLKMELSESQSEADLKVMLVPSAAYSYRETFDEATNFDEGEAFDKARLELGDMLIDLADDLGPYVSDAIPGTDEVKTSGPVDCYYKTDHHWNYNGAEKAADVFREYLLMDEEEHTPVELTDDFKGTLYSKVLLSERVRDRIEAPEDSLDMNVKVTIGNDEYDSIYFMDRLENKDKYEVFFGGNYDRVDIVNEEDGAEDKPSLLIVKDSYANSFVPFILDDFSSITMVDTRYFRDSVKDVTLREEFDHVLILYSMTNFAEEKLNLTERALM